MRRRMFLPVIALLTAAILIACAGGGQESTRSPIKVGSKDFTEQFILGEIYALTLEQAGLPVERK